MTDAGAGPSELDHLLQCPHKWGLDPTPARLVALIRASVFALGGPAAATNECAMRGQISDSGSYEQMYAHEPSLTCDGGSIKYVAKDTSSSAWATKYLDWNFLAQGTYVYGVTKYDISSAQGKSWTVVNIWYTWG